MCAWCVRACPPRGNTGYGPDIQASLIIKLFSPKKVLYSPHRTRGRAQRSGAASRDIKYGMPSLAVPSSESEAKRRRADMRVFLCSCAHVQLCVSYRIHGAYSDVCVRSAR